MWNILSLFIPRVKTSEEVNNEFIKEIKEANKKDLLEMIKILMKEYESR